MSGFYVLLLMLLAFVVGGIIVGIYTWQEIKKIENNVTKRFLYIFN